MARSNLEPEPEKLQIRRALAAAPATATIVPDVVRSDDTGDEPEVPPPPDRPESQSGSGARKQSRPATGHPARRYADLPRDRSQRPMDHAVHAPTSPPPFPAPARNSNGSLNPSQVDGNFYDDELPPELFDREERTSGRPLRPSCMWPAFRRYLLIQIYRAPNRRIIKKGIGYEHPGPKPAFRRWHADDARRSDPDHSGRCVVHQPAWPSHAGATGR